MELYTFHLQHFTKIDILNVIVLCQSVSYRSYLNFSETVGSHVKNRSLPHQNGHCVCLNFASLIR